MKVKSIALLSIFTISSLVEAKKIDLAKPKEKKEASTDSLLQRKRKEAKEAIEKAKKQLADKKDKAKKQVNKWLTKKAKELIKREAKKKLNKKVETAKQHLYKNRYRYAATSVTIATILCAKRLYSR
jgi:hypothetical protein